MTDPSLEAALEKAMQCTCGCKGPMPIEDDHIFILTHAYRQKVEELEAAHRVQDCLKRDVLALSEQLGKDEEMLKEFEIRAEKAEKELERVKLNLIQRLKETAEKYDSYISCLEKSHDERWCSHCESKNDGAEEIINMVIEEWEEEVAKEALARIGRDK